MVLDGVLLMRIGRQKTGHVTLPHGLQHFRGVRIGGIIQDGGRVHANYEGYSGLSLGLPDNRLKQMGYFGFVLGEEITGGKTNAVDEVLSGDLD